MGGQKWHHCSLPGCEKNFKTRSALNDHMQHHTDSPETGNWLCETCKWPFNDSLALDEHHRQTGHGASHQCDNCSEVFATANMLGKHRQFPSECSDAFSKKSDTVHCHACTKTFGSQASHDHHMLRCRLLAAPISIVAPAKDFHNVPPPKPPTRPSSKPVQAAPLAPLAPLAPTRKLEKPIANSSLAPTLKPEKPIANGSLGRLSPAITQALPNTPIQPTHAPHVCGIGHCTMSFKSEPALKVHKVDKHGLGGKKLDLNGRDVHMLSQHARQQLSNAGVLRPSPGPFRVRSRGSQATPPPAAIPSVGGPEEMAQANKICEQMMRLVLQTDVFIRHDGKMKCSGIEWTRISVAKQITIVDMFDGICNLPKKLQYSEYVPPPLTFNKDYQCRYPVADFKLSPEQNDAQPALKIVAIYCSKVVLENNNLEAVKIAAVDVVTCRILMNHLVCTDSKNLVKDWCTESTGLNGYQDIEAARQDGYKVLKGWTAARTAMWNFIDRDTIIVGHSVRSDLDCLRMIHGRAVDVAKTFENAAKKELLPKQQLSLESLCRDLPAIKLTTHPSFGRDALQNAFAARELGLWMLKYPEKLEKTAKAKAAEFRRFAPVSQA